MRIIVTESLGPSEKAANRPRTSKRTKEAPPGQDELSKAINRLFATPKGKREKR